MLQSLSQVLTDGGRRALISFGERFPVSKSKKEPDTEEMPSEEDKVKEE